MRGKFNNKLVLYSLALAIPLSFSSNGIAQDLEDTSIGEVIGPKSNMSYLSSKKINLPFEISEFGLRGNFFGNIDPGDNKRIVSGLDLKSDSISLTAKIDPKNPDNIPYSFSTQIGNKVGYSLNLNNEGIANSKLSLKPLEKITYELFNAPNTMRSSISLNLNGADMNLSYVDQSKDYIKFSLGYKGLSIGGDTLNDRIQLGYTFGEFGILYGNDKEHGESIIFAHKPSFSKDSQGNDKVLSELAKGVFMLELSPDFSEVKTKLYPFRSKKIKSELPFGNLPDLWLGCNYDKGEIGYSAGINLKWQF